MPQALRSPLAASLAALFAAFVAAAPMVGPAQAQDGQPAAFEDQLMRLMEILGSVEVLRGLCGDETGAWRARAEALVAAEAETEALRGSMIAAYNRGNRAFAAYRTCTASAVFAIERYMDEGEALARDVLVRYGD